MNFDTNVYNKLLEKTSLKTQNVFSKFFFTSTSKTLCENGDCRLYKYWGGESIYQRSEKFNSRIFEEISLETIPCLFIGNLEFHDIDDGYDIARKIILFHIIQKLNKEIPLTEGFQSESSTIPYLVTMVKYSNPLFKQYVGNELFDKVK